MDLHLQYLVLIGDYYIVSVGGTEVGIATYSRPGISSVYSGDWIVGIDTNAYSILSYSQQVVAPRQLDQISLIL